MTKQTIGIVTIYTDPHGRAQAWVGTHLLGTWNCVFEAGYWLSENGWIGDES